MRGTSFAKQFGVLLWRNIQGFWRVPLVVFAIFGMSIFAIMLIASIYGNCGQFSFGFDMEQNKSGIKDWVGLSFYMTSDIFAWGIMS